MNKKSIAFSGLLFIVLVMTSLFLSKSDVQGVASDTDINLSTDASSYVLGETIEFTGSIDFTPNEEATLHGVDLDVTGPQAMSVTLPVAAGNYDLSSEPGVAGTLQVVVSHNNITTLGGTLPGGTLPGSNQADPYGGQFSTTGAGGSIDYAITWIPPVFLDPAPNFTLVPNFDVLFPIPLLAGPGGPSGTELPNTALQFAIPTVNASSSSSALPDVDFEYNIPQVSISTNASSSLPDLPDTSSQTTDGGFDIPTLPVATSTFPDLSGGSPASAFAIPGSANAGGVAHDGTDFYLVSKGTGGGGVDQIVKVNSSGTVDASWGTSGFVDAPSSRIDGMAYLDSSLWVLENEFRCHDTVEPGFCDRSHRVFELPLGGSLPSSDSDWGALTKLYTIDIFEEMGGITTQGTGSSGTLWLGNKFGWRFYNINQAGSEVDSPFTNQFLDGIDAFAYNDEALYAGKNGNISKWDTNGNRQNEFFTNRSNIRGMTFVSNVLYMADGSDIYAAFVGESVTTVPRGIGYSPSTAAVGEALWILVDGDPVDKILKVDPSDGSLISAFGTSGGADAPIASTEGITFLGGSLYVVGNVDFSPKLYIISATNGSLTQTIDLQSSASIFDDVGGITNDGTDLIIHSRNGTSIWEVDTSGNLTGVEQVFPCCPSVFGARGLTYNSSRGLFYAAKNSALITYDSTINFQAEQTLTVDGGQLSGVEGLVFNQDVLYVARNDSSTGRVSVGALRTNVTTQPRGLAFSQSGSAYLGNPIGEALWAVVDGSPSDYLLKIDPTTGNLDTSFGTNGAVALTTDKAEGITFFDNILWVGANEGFDRRLFRINATNGNSISTLNLNQCPGPCSFFDNIGGVSNDGSSLIVFPSSFDRAVYLNDDGTLDQERWVSCCPSGSEGGNAIAYRSSASQLLSAKNMDIRQFGVSGSELHEIDTHTTTVDDIEGMVFDPGTVGDGSDELLYITHYDSGNTVGKVYTSVIPTGISTDPRGLAYDEDDNELYILVDGSVADHILVVDPTDTPTATVIRDFPAPDNDAHAITFLDDTLYVLVRDNNCCPPPTVHALDPMTGAESSQIDVGPALFFNGAHGLANDGDNLIATPEFGSEAVFIDPSDGDEDGRIFFFDPGSFNFFVDGFDALAFRSNEEEFVPVKDDEVFQFNEDGALIDSFQLAGGVDDVKGAVFVGNTLYMAEAQGNTIQTALIPVPTNTITDEPLGMATDGTDLFVVVDGSFRDQIIKMDTSGNLDNTFGGGDGVIDSPGQNTGGIAVHMTNNGGATSTSLFIVTNDQRTIHGQFGGFDVVANPIIHEIDAATGELIEDFEIFVEDPFDPFSPPKELFDPIGALSSDGTHLYAGIEGSGFIDGVWFKIDPTNPDNPAETIIENSNVFPYMPGFDSFEITSGAEFPTDRQLVASGRVFGAQSDTLARFNKDTGEMADQVTLNGNADIKGMAYIGLTLYMADADSRSILGTALLENTIELTIVGNYDSQLVTDYSPSAGINDTSSSALANFDVDRNTDFFVQLSSPTDNFVATSSDATIAGRVSDPAVNSVEVGIQLPFTQLISDSVDGSSTGLWDTNSSTGGAAQWHVACLGDPFPPRVNSPNCSWRYAKPGESSFDTGAQTSGTLTSDEAFDVNPGTTLEFMTGYLAEPSHDVDMLLIEVAPVASGQFKKVAQIVGPGFGGNPPPADAHPSFMYIELDPLFINPNLVPVSLDLSAFAGERVRVRFTFDSVDQFANQGEGWYLDDIVVQGAGTKTIIIGTTALNPPVDDGGVTYYRSFSTPFTLAEGQNIVGAFAEQPYSPFLGQLVTVSGFVDQTAPVVTLSGLPAATSNLFQTLQGTISDNTFQSLTVNQTSPGGSAVPIFTLNSLPESGTFSVPVSLNEGATTFEAIATDGGGLSSTATLQVLADITAPTASMKVVTMTSEGEAKTGDQFFVVVAAEDNLSGISSVVDNASNDTLAPIADVPAILREMHGLGDVSGTPTTHILLSSVPSNTPVGLNAFSVNIIDNAGNQASASANLDVVATRSNRNYFLFPGVNYMGLALIPDDGDSLTLDDAKLDRLMTQDVTNNVDSAYAAALGGSVTLGDVIESTFAFNDAGNFIVHTPGAGAADTLTDLVPFQGMIVKAKATDTVSSTQFDVFQKVSVEGFTAQQSVPIRVNIEGVFFTQDQLPPDKTLRVGYNLIAPHILEDALFDTVYRGALIPKQLAVSAITFERRTDAVEDGTDMTAEIFEGFVTQSIGGILKPVLSYWTFVVDDPTNPVPPTITP